MTCSEVSRAPRLRPLAFVAAILASALSLGAQAAECAAAKPEWIFCEDFEGSASTFLSRWQDVSHRDRKTRETAAASVFEGSSSLRLTFPVGDLDGGGWMQHWWTPSTNQSEVFLRWYVKYSSGFQYGNWDVKKTGLGASQSPGSLAGRAGTRPDGTWFLSRVLSLGVYDDRGAQPAKAPLLYYYYPDQSSAWGDFGYQNREPKTVLSDNAWHCLEMRIKPNTVIDNGNGTYNVSSDGEQSLWINGELKALYTGFRWRTRPNVYINDVFMSAWIGEPTATTVQYRWEDNYVVSTKRIGCYQATGRPGRPRNIVVN